jgi:hypothetical protein
MPSEYLLRPLRFLREACRDITAAHPELTSRDCDTCTHSGLCGIDERAGHASLKLVRIFPNVQCEENTISEFKFIRHRSVRCHSPASDLAPRKDDEDTN